MSKGLSMAARREITKNYAREYGRANRTEKSRLLDALVKTTGWNRDHARRAIRTAAARKGTAREQQRKPRPRKYSYDALMALQKVWALQEQPSGKYLTAVMGDTLERLIRFNELGRIHSRVSDALLDELRSMSAATIDRHLKPHRDAHHPQALGTTKPSHILHSSIPVRTTMDDPPPGPGFYELDTTAHCGHTTKGEYLHTLTATDPVTGWTLIHAIRNNTHINIKAGMDWIQQHSPVPIAGMDFDNGSEFLNWSVSAWCDERDISITRSRPHQHNDNAHVEQRNGDWARRHAFCYRYETDDELRLFNELHSLVMKRKNFLLPCVKATSWTRTSAERKKRVYDKPKAPYQRPPRHQRPGPGHYPTPGRRTRETQPRSDHPRHHPHPATTHQPRRRPHPGNPPRSLNHTDLLT